jgi:hypothetical protein
VHEAALLKLQAGLSQHDAYKAANIDPKAQRAERKYGGDKSASGKGGEFVSLTPEQRKLMEKQREGEELTADEMKELKEIRKLLRESEKAGATDDPATAKKGKKGDKGGDMGGDGKAKPGHGKGKGKGKGKGEKPPAPADDGAGEKPADGSSGGGR